MSLISINIDPKSLSSPSDQVEHERKVAIFDLIEKNVFCPHDAQNNVITDADLDLRLALEDNRLVFEVQCVGNQINSFARKYILSLAPFRGLMRDYMMICESYYEALKNMTPSQIESIDMGRRGIHNEGAILVAERLKGKIDLDHETARRLFTLIYALHLRA